MADKHIFLSYSRKDSDFASKLTDDITCVGYAVWMDKTEITGGSIWDKEIENAIFNAQVEIVIISKNSLESDNVRNEITFALDNDVPLLPLKYRTNRTFIRINTVQFVDFSSDKNYCVHFIKLLEELVKKYQLSEDDFMDQIEKFRIKNKIASKDFVSIVEEFKIKFKIKEESLKNKIQVYIAFLRNDKTEPGLLSKILEALKKIKLPVLNKSFWKNFVLTLVIGAFGIITYLILKQVPPNSKVIDTHPDSTNVKIPDTSKKVEIKKDSVVQLPDTKLMLSWDAKLFYKKFNAIKQTEPLKREVQIYSEIENAYSNLAKTVPDSAIVEKSKISERVSYWHNYNREVEIQFASDIKVRNWLDEADKLLDKSNKNIELATSKILKVIHLTVGYESDGCEIIMRHARKLYSKKDPCDPNFILFVKNASKIKNTKEVQGYLNDCPD